MFAAEKRGLRVRRDRTAQPLMFLQNYLVDKCSIINLNPLAKRIHKYLNNGLFRVLPVYQTCHMSTFYIFPTAGKKRAELNLMDGFSIWVVYSRFQNEKRFVKWTLITKTRWYLGRAGGASLCPLTCAPCPRRGIWPVGASCPGLAARAGQSSVSRCDMSHIRPKGVL